MAANWWDKKNSPSRARLKPWKGHQELQSQYRGVSLPLLAGSRALQEALRVLKLVEIVGYDNWASLWGKKCRDEKKPEAHSGGGAFPLVLSTPICGTCQAKSLLGFFLWFHPCRPQMSPWDQVEACLLCGLRTWHETRPWQGEGWVDKGLQDSCGWDWKCLLGLEDLSLEGFDDQIFLEYFFLCFKSRKKYENVYTELSHFTPHPKKMTHFYQFLSTASRCRYQLTQIGTLPFLTQEECTQCSISYFSSLKPKSWYSLLLCIAVTTVVANRAIIVESRNAEDHQVNILAAERQAHVGWAPGFSHVEPVSWQRRRCCSAPLPTRDGWGWEQVSIVGWRCVWWGGFPGAKWAAVTFCFS